MRTGMSAVDDTARASRAGRGPILLAVSQVIAVFGPTGVGKTAVAIALAERLRERGEDPVAVSADAMQVYAGLPILTGAADSAGAGSGSSTGCSASCRSTRRSPPARTRSALTRRSTG